MGLPVAVVLADEERGIELFGSSVERLALGSIVYAPAAAGLALLAFEVEQAPAVYQALITKLAAYNCYARAAAAAVSGSEVASVYDGWIRYEERDMPDRETFQSICALFANGSGDCADLVAARCAEPDALAAGGVPRLELIGSKPSGGNLYHATVIYPDGSSEDPSVTLGMPSPKRNSPWHCLSPSSSS